MRENLQGRLYKLKYHPFPFHNKREKEFTIGEALLRYKGIPESDIETLRNIEDDPPDLLVDISKSGQISIEVTESVPYDRDSDALSNKFIRKLRDYLERVGVRPSKQSNIFIYRNDKPFPKINTKQLLAIGEKINHFFNSQEYELNYDKIHKIMSAPVELTFIPALGNFKNPDKFYINNIYIKDITGYPINHSQIVETFNNIYQKKLVGTADILAIFHNTIGMVGLSNEDIMQIKELCQNSVSYNGIYIIELFQAGEKYWVHVETLLEHPILK